MVKRNQTRALVIMGLMTAILIIFSFTPIGTMGVKEKMMRMAVIRPFSSFFPLRPSERSPSDRYPSR